MALYTTTSFPLTSLVEDIAQGKIGLPDIQRPFVWPNVNVRNLFDSLYKGYPAGYLLFWETGTEASTRSVSGQERQKAPSMVIGPTSPGSEFGSRSTPFNAGSTSQTPLS